MGAIHIRRETRLPRRVCPQPGRVLVSSAHLPFLSGQRQRPPGFTSASSCSEGAWLIVSSCISWLLCKVESSPSRPRAELLLLNCYPVLTARVFPPGVLCLLLFRVLLFVRWCFKPQVTLVTFSVVSDSAMFRWRSPGAAGHVCLLVPWQLSFAAFKCFILHQLCKPGPTCFTPHDTL